MAYGYVFAQIDVTDPKVYRDYVAMVGPIVASFGGEFLARGGQAASYEGTPAGARNVLIRFPSYQAAQDWYHSSDYAAARAVRMSASTSVQTILEGL